MGRKFDIVVKPHANLTEEIAENDIIFVATGAPTPTIRMEHIRTDKPVLILDLSIPRNVDIEIDQRPNVTLIHMDELSRLTDKTLANRKQDLPKANAVLQEIKTDFYAWVDSRKMMPTLNALNDKLTVFNNSALHKITKNSSTEQQQQMRVLSNKMVQKMTTQFASYLRSTSTDMDKDIALINEIFKI